MATAATGSITNAVILVGSGSISRMTWISAPEQPRSYTCDFRVHHFGWSEILIQFTPQNNRAVDLTLMGPWDQPPGGTTIYRQELLWDDLSATNATLANPSFESGSSLPTSWSRPYGDATAVTDPSLALAGNRYVLIPAALGFARTAEGAVQADLALVLADVRNGMVLWRSAATGRGATPDAALRAAMAAVLPLDAGGS